MEWIIKIENEIKQRILVKFDSQNELLIFVGQLKPYNKPWVDFSEIKQPIWISYPHIIPGTLSNMGLINLEMIQEILINTHDLMKKRVTAYKEIAEAFEHIKVIEFTNEEENVKTSEII
jgi:hypothetical protein